jgi:hypothetical protein
VKPDVISPEDADLKTVKWLVSRIVTWTPIKIGAETCAFSDDAATRPLLKPEMAPYIGQIVDYLQSERAFLPTSAALNRQMNGLGDATKATRLLRSSEMTRWANKRHPSCDGADREEGRGSNEHHVEDHELHVRWRSPDKSNAPCMNA